MGISLTLRTYLHVFHLIIFGGEAMTKEDAVEYSVNITSEKNIKLKQKQKIPTSSCTPMSWSSYCLFPRTLRSATKMSLPSLFLPGSTAVSSQWSCPSGISSSLKYKSNFRHTDFRPAAAALSFGRHAQGTPPGFCKGVDSRALIN